MVEAKLRVETTETSNDETVFYGNIIRKNVIEKTLIRDFDKRDKGTIAPCGIVATFVINKDEESNHFASKEIIDIKVNRYYLEEDVLPNTYHCFFHKDEKVYELYAHIDGKQLVHVGLAEWLNCGDFEDGAEYDNVYDTHKNLVSCDILES